MTGLPEGLTAIYQPVEGGWVQAHIKELPAVVTASPTRHEAEADLLDALREYQASSTETLRRGSMSKYKRIPVDTLVVDARYQRPLDKARVDQIVRGFDPHLFGALDVSRRNGKAAVWDGQHRLAAARKLGMDAVPCLEHVGLSPEREAELFVMAQRARKGISQVDRFRARLFTDDPEAVAISEICDANGYRIGTDSATSFRAITSLERVYRAGNLPETLSMLQHLWGGDEKSTDGGLLEGLSLILRGYGHRIDTATRDRLRAVPPVVILRRAIGHSGGGSSKGVMVAGEIRKVAGLRGRPRVEREKAAA